jgi:hypothetical protein
MLLVIDGAKAMTTMTQTYTNDSTAMSEARERTGGPGGAPTNTTREATEYFMSNTPFGSHMPLDIQMHWNWRNPLNVIPALMLVLFVLSVVGLIVQ